MAYKFYCTDCGKELNQSNVLFDMQQILSPEADKLKILQFRLTEQELRSMVDSGTPAEDGYKACSITLEQFLNVVTNERNLGAADENGIYPDTSAIRSLTIAEIKAFLDEKNGLTALAAKTAKKGRRRSDDEDEEEEPEEEMVVQSTAKKEFIAVAAIRETMNKINKDKSFGENTLVDELRLLYALFSNPGTIEAKPYPFLIRLKDEPANDGERIIVGYMAKGGTTGATVNAGNARVCPRCGERIFEHAGTAEHKLVTFIGRKESGKTSTIVALADYAQNALTGGLSTNHIWGKSGARASAITSVDSIELLTNNKCLNKDIDWFVTGIAPDKTPLAKGHAYSATFRLNNKDNPDKYYLLTLTDIPGELLNDEAGELLVAQMAQFFTSALVCDAFVLCFDMTAEPEKMKRTIDFVTKCANGIQIQRSAHMKASGKSVPIMVTFNKCFEIENDTNYSAVGRSDTDCVRACYRFKKERDGMAAAPVEAKEVYKLVRETILKYDTLKDAYQTYLRIAPFGFKAPGDVDIREMGLTNLNPDGSIKYPKPINIDELMCWILAVSGCIPTGSWSKPYLDADESEYFAPANNYFQRPQYKTEAPMDINEASARCYLFEEPTELDVETLDKAFVGGGVGGWLQKLFQKLKNKKAGKGK